MHRVHTSYNQRLDGTICRQFQSFSFQRQEWWKIQCNAQRRNHMTNGFVLNALSDKETEDARSFNEENEKEILIMIEKDIQEFKNKHTMY